MFKSLIKYWVYLFLLIFSVVPIIFVKIELPLVIILLVFLMWLNNKLKITKFPLILFIFSLLLRITIVLLVDTPPVSDFEVLYNASKSINIHDFSFNNTSYFYYWAYQIGFVFIQSLFLKIINSIMFLKIINCFVTSGICVLTYYISKEFIREKYARVVATFYTVMIFPLTYVTVLTNQHLSTLFIYLALYFLISKKGRISDFKKYLLSGVLISLGNIIRPEGIITIFSIVLYLLFVLKKENLKNTIKNILTLVSSYYLVFIICSNLFIISGIGPYGLSNNAPYWKFVLGFNYDTVGQYSDSDAYVLGNKDEAYNLIKSRVLDKPLKLVKLFFKKSDIFWNRSTLNWTFYDFYDNNIFIFGRSYKVIEITNKLNKYNENSLLVMYILMIIGIFNYINKKEWNKKVLLLINQVFITFGVYLLIEIQTRYAYFIEISTVMLMGLGIEYLDKKRLEYKKLLKIGKKQSSL